MPVAVNYDVEGVDCRGRQDEKAMLVCVRTVFEGEWSGEGRNCMVSVVWKVCNVMRNEKDV